MTVRLPPDPTPEEIKILAFGRALIYQKLPDPIDKFIVVYVFELGQDRQDAAMALGITYKAVWERIKRIRVKLAMHYPTSPLPEGNELN